MDKYKPYKDTKISTDKTSFQQDMLRPYMFTKNS